MTFKIVLFSYIYKGDKLKTKRNPQVTEMKREVKIRVRSGTDPDSDIQI